MAAAIAAEVPISIKDIYDCEDRNFLITVACLVERTIEIRDDAMRKMKQENRG